MPSRHPRRALLSAIFLVIGALGVYEPASAADITSAPALAGDGPDAAPSPELPVVWDRHRRARARRRFGQGLTITGLTVGAVGGAVALWGYSVLRAPCRSRPCETSAIPLMTGALIAASGAPLVAIGAPIWIVGRHQEVRLDIEASPHGPATLSLSLRPRGAARRSRGARPRSAAHRSR